MREQHVIRARGLEKTKLMDRRPATAKVADRDEKFTLVVRDLMHGQTDRFLLATPADAKLYELQLMAALSDLKAWIGLNTETGQRCVMKF